MKRKLQIQFFAEPTTDPQEKTLDELLRENPTLQAEFDRKMEGARGKWQKSWQEKADADKAEAERIARMSEEEKQQEALKKLKQERDESQASLNAYRLEVNAQKIASEKGVDIALLSTINYREETQDTVEKKIEAIGEAFNKAVETAVNEKLKQAGPTQHSPEVKSADKAYLDAKYKNNPYYKQ